MRGRAFLWEHPWLTPPRPVFPSSSLMRRGFELDVLACPRCGGRMRLIATIEDPRVGRRILAHLGLPTEVPQPRPPPAQAADLLADLPA